MKPLNPSMDLHVLLENAQDEVEEDDAAGAREHEPDLDPLVQAQLLLRGGQVNLHLPRHVGTMSLDVTLTQCH